MSWVRRLAAATGAVLLAFGSAAPVSAESALWTMTASPLAVTTGVPTTFTLTATNEDPLAALLTSAEIGCVQVDVPANFAVTGAQVTGSNSGSSWTAAVTGNRVKVWAGSGGDRLELLGWVRFTVRATASSVGSLAWASRAFQRQDCGGTGTVLGVPPIVVVSGPTATPTPVPTPVPTATPRPTPAPTPPPTATPTPTPLLPLPSVLPTLPPILGSPTPTPSPTPRPSDGTDPERPTPSPGGDVGGSPDRPSPTDGAAPSGSADANPGSGVGGPGGPATPASPGVIVSGPTVVLEPADIELGGAGIGILGGIDVWVVPGAAIGGPGLVILLWIALQAVGTFAWLPAVRSLRGAEGPAA